MSYQVLARKWRPKSFDELAGQAHVLRALTNALDSDRLHHAYLFTGTRGVGKTTIARILAKCLNCEGGVTSKPCGECGACREIDEGRFVDLIEVDAASRTKVEDTRELLDNVQYAPTRGRFKVYLVDEVHMLSNHSFNALLKTLEEPPPHVKFLLATTDPQKVPVTILSRCLQFNLKRMPAGLIVDHLNKVLAAESIEFESSALALLARAADGSMRDALSLLDQAIAFGAGAVREAEVRGMLGSIERGFLFDLLRAVSTGDGPAAMDAVARMAERTPDFADAAHELLALLHLIAMMQVVPEAVADDEPEREALAELAGLIDPETAQLLYQIALKGRQDLPMAPDPHSGFEMLVLRMLAFRPGEPGGQAATPAAAPQRKPAAATKPPAATPASASAAAPDSVQAAASGDWQAIFEKLNLTGPAALLASHCAWGGQEGSQVVLNLARNHAHLITESRLSALTEALGGAFGASVTVKLNQVDEVADDTPAEQAAAAEADRQQQAESNIESDPTVQAFKETFGAELVPNSVRPSET